MVNAEGTNIWDVLKEDQLLRDSNGVNAPKLGKLYYEKLRQEYQYSNAPVKQLKPKDNAELLNEELLQALDDLQSTTKKFEKIPLTS